MGEALVALTAVTVALLAAGAAVIFVLLAVRAAMTRIGDRRG